MDELKKIEGKTIKSFEKDFDGIYSYIIIKFEEGGKINITSFPEDDGVGQLDLFGLKEEKEYIGKRINKVVEEYDGANNYLIFKFKDGSEFTITSFSSGEEGYAGIDITVYSSEKLVVESLDELLENTYSDSRHGQYPMYKPQYESGEDEIKKIAIVLSKRGFPKRIFNELKKYYDDVKLNLELGDGKIVVIVVNDLTASIEDISDLLYKDIENGIVSTIDEI
jgi:rRNA maturation protein Rpf1